MRYMHISKYGKIRPIYYFYYMDFLLSNISINILIQDVASILVSILIGFLIWLIKYSYDKYSIEIIELKKTEIILSKDLARNTDNKEYLDTWMKNLKLNRLYSCSFRKYKLDDLDISKILNIQLVSKLNLLGYGLKGLEDDLENVYKGYIDTSAKFLNSDHVKEWETFNANTLVFLEVLKQNFIDSEKDLKETIAYLRAYYKQKSFSIFKIFTKLSQYNLPQLTEKKVAFELQKINEELTSKSHNSNVS